MSRNVEQGDWVTMTVSNPNAELGRIRPSSTGGYVAEHKDALGCGVIIGFLMMFVGAGTFALFASISVEGEGGGKNLGEWLGLLWLAIPTLGIAWLGFLMVRNILSLRHYRPAQVFMPHEHFFRGQQLEIDFNYPRSNGVLGKEGKVMGRLVCLKVRRVEDTDGPGYNYPFEELLIIPLPTKEVSASQNALEAHWEIALPADIPTTAIGKDEWTVWQVQVLTYLGGKILNRGLFPINVI